MTAGPPNPTDAGQAAELVGLKPDVIFAAATVAGPCCRWRPTSDRVPLVADPVERRLRRQPGAAGRQHHRLHKFEFGDGREMAGAPARDRAGVTRVAVALQSGQSRPRPDTVKSIQAVAPSLGVQCQHRPTCTTRGDRAAIDDFAPPERRPDRAPGGATISSRADRRAGSAAQIARRLLLRSTSPPAAWFPMA